MRSGFKFNNHHSSEFGVTVRTKSRPIVPAVKSFAVELPYRDGEYDFSEANDEKRLHYSPRVFNLDIFVTADSLSKLQEKLGKLSMWLCGCGELVFDDIPLVVWRGRIIDEIVYMPEHGGKQTMISVSLRVNPFPACVFGTEGPVLDTALKLDSAMPLSLSELYIFTVKNSAVLNIVNFGDRPLKPRIYIEGNAGNVTLTLNGKSLSFTANGDCEVDFDKQTVRQGASLLKINGEFFEFGEGKNRLSCVNSTADTLTVTAQFNPEYMYDADFTENRWGNDNA